MKARFLMFFALLFASQLLFAQAEDDDEKVKIKDQLELSEPQELAWKETHKDFREKAKAIKEKYAKSDDKEDKKARQQAMKTAREARDARIKEILTKEQWAKYEAHKAAKKEENQGKGKGDGKGKWNKKDN
jgi:periplasmic protein CpxP/Spy